MLLKVIESNECGGLGIYPTKKTLDKDVSRRFPNWANANGGNFLESEILNS